MFGYLQVFVAAAQHAPGHAAHRVRLHLTFQLHSSYIESRYAKLTLLTSINTLGCSALQLPPPHVLASGSAAIMNFLSFMLAGATGTTLDLSLQQLTTLPAACANSTLVSLKLVCNSLRCIPVEFGRQAHPQPYSG